MCAHYGGLHARIRELDEFAIYVPCTGHSLNLVGIEAVGRSVEPVKYVGFIQRLQFFFSLFQHIDGIS